MKNTIKKTDAVKLMRNIRDELHKKYQKNPAMRKKDLKIVQRKYMK